VSNRRIRKKKAKQNGTYFTGFRSVPVAGDNAAVDGFRLARLVNWEGKVLSWRQAGINLVGEEK